MDLSESDQELLNELLLSGPPRLFRTVTAMSECNRALLIDQQQKHPCQRPSLFIYPEIASVPFFDEQQHPMYAHALNTLQDPNNLALMKQECQHIFYGDSDTLKENDDELLSGPKLDRIFSSTNKEGTWNAFYLVNQGAVDHERIALCPETWRILQEAFPNHALCTGSGIGYVYFSRIKPGTHITPHCGVCNLKLRLQLPLQVDSHQEVKIRVADEWRTYVEGEAMIFDDTFNHEVIFKSDDTKSAAIMDRIVLLVDFWHPELTETEIKATQLLLPPPDD